MTVLWRWSKTQGIAKPHDGARENTHLVDAEIFQSGIVVGQLTDTGILGTMTQA